MKLYRKPFIMRFNHILNNEGAISTINIKKVKDEYDIIISVDSLELTLSDIKYTLEKVNETYYSNNIKFRKILIEL